MGQFLVWKAARGESKNGSGRYPERKGFLRSNIFFKTHLCVFWFGVLEPRRQCLGHLFGVCMCVLFVR